MTTAAIAGYSAQFYVSDDGGTTWTALGETRDMTLSVTNNEVEATSFDSAGWMEVLGGLREWEASTESLWVYANGAQTDVFTALTGSSSVKIRFLPKTGTGLSGYTGTAICTSWEVSAAVDDVVTLSVTFKGTGALTTYTAA